MLQALGGVVAFAVAMTLCFLYLRAISRAHRDLAERSVYWRWRGNLVNGALRALLALGVVVLVVRLAVAGAQAVLG